MRLKKLQHRWLLKVFFRDVRQEEGWGKDKKDNDMSGEGKRVGKGRLEEIECNDMRLKETV